MKIVATDAAFVRPQGEYDTGSVGIDIRTYIATAALQGLLANPERTCNSVDDDAVTAVMAADALIAELNKSRGE
jgi:hypothetical protein